jgi:hypothetical protein
VFAATAGRACAFRKNNLRVTWPLHFAYYDFRRIPYGQNIGTH